MSLDGLPGEFGGSDVPPLGLMPEPGVEIVG
jgi:hypothetical protein